jgi:hypothetical protein
MNKERKNTYIGVPSPCSSPLSGMVVVDCGGHVNVGTVSCWDGCWTVDGGDKVSDSKLISSNFKI